MITSEAKLCIGIGYPIKKSLGPIIHNSGLKAAGLDSQFTYVSMNIPPQKLEEFIDFARSSNIRGITVTLPHKQTVIKFLDHIDPVAQKIGAVNTIVIDQEKLIGHNTDWIGATKPISEISTLKDKKVAVIGAGGAARAFSYGLLDNEAKVTIFNRTEEKAKQIASIFGCEFASLKDIKLVRDFDIICNASSIGFSGSSQEDATPVPKEYLNSNQIVFDAVYSPLETKLLKNAKESGAKTITGTQMLLHQAYAQFELYYQAKAPKLAMESALMEFINNER